MLLLIIAAATAKPFPGCKGGTLAGCPSVANCTVHWLEQHIDHFNWAAPLNDSKKRTFQQRYFVNDKYWDKENHGPVFFYFGNEDNVELYVNHTGLMWEAAEEFGALLVFGEHRYYGDSLPYAPHTPGCMNYLTSEQAMADFAYLIDHLRTSWGASHSAVIGFGGSYGGMLGAWFRVHYPNAVDGVIAASAPIWSFEGLDPPYDYDGFNEAVTFDASAAGGGPAADRCKDNLKAAWPRVLKAAQTAAGRKLLGSSFRACDPIRPRDKSGSHDDAVMLINWAQGPWGTMAMGNYPYASSYLMHGLSLLPAWPVRVACERLGGFDAAGVADAALFTAVREAAAVYHNNTGTAKCFDVTGQRAANAPPPRRYMTSPAPLPLPRTSTTSPAMRSSSSSRPSDGLAAASGPETCLGDWDWQWCTEMTQPFVQGTPSDMFYCPDGTYRPRENCSHWDPNLAGCQRRWGVTPRPEWARVALGGKRIRDVTNIVFSNGLQDPWHRGGVLTNLSSSLLAIVLPNGAHHIDLMFSDPGDAPYPDIAWAREFERAQMRRWVKEHAARRVLVR